MSLVVEVVTGRTTAELLAARDRATGDIVELRTDYAADIDVAALLSGRRKPVIVTCRPAWEGGQFSGAEEERLRVLSDAIRLGADYVDVEWKADRRQLPVTRDGQLVLSHHDFEELPSDLADRVRAMRAERPGVVKVAVAVKSLRDVAAVRRITAQPEPHVAIAMGAAGQVSRLCPVRFGSAWTYGAQSHQDRTAPGQVSARELQERYRIAQQDERTQLFGIAGRPLGHSASPAMHNAAFAALGLNAVYVPFETDDADELLAVAEEFGVDGLSVTAPLKTAVHERAGADDEVSRQTGSANTLRRSTQGWLGRNYDVAGFLAPFHRRGLSLVGRRAVVLGSGGAARTAAVALHGEGANVEISARRRDAAEALASALRVQVGAYPPAGGWDVLVNTTPVGTWPNVEASPLNEAALHGGLVYDLVYNPERTTLLEWASTRGIETIGGLEMLVGQARHQFRWWIGQEAPGEVMFNAAQTFIEQAREQQR